jgi:hypothetical protein
MSDITVTPQPPAAPKSLPARLFGVVLSPGETFRSVIAQPRWFGALASILLLMAAANFAFLSTSVGQDATLEQQIKSMEAWGMTVTAEQQTQMEAGISKAPYWGAAMILIVGSLMTFLIAAILYGVFNGFAGGGATFKQVLAVLSHAGAISLVGQLFTLPLNYVRESASTATNLAVFLPFLDEGSLAARFLGMIDLFFIWWLIVVGIGLAVLYRKRTGSVVMSLLGAYVLIVGVIAGVMRAVAGGQ